MGNTLILKIQQITSLKMDHKNMSLEDLIKKDRQHKKFSGNPKFQGARGGFKSRGGNQGGNVVPRFRNQPGGIFKKR